MQKHSLQRTQQFRLWSLRFEGSEESEKALAMRRNLSCVTQGHGNCRGTIVKCPTKVVSRSGRTAVSAMSVSDFPFVRNRRELEGPRLNLKAVTSNFIDFADATCEFSKKEVGVSRVTGLFQLWLNYAGHLRSHSDSKCSYHWSPCPQETVRSEVLGAANRLLLFANKTETQS